MNEGPGSSIELDFERRQTKHGLPLEVEVVQPMFGEPRHGLDRNPVRQTRV
jgi:hypothetical protein